MREPKTKYVTYGWEGSEHNAIELMAEVAFYFFILCRKYADKLDVKTIMARNVCSDVIGNYKNGETTYILEPQYNQTIRNMGEFIKKIKIAD